MNEKRVLIVDDEEDIGMMVSSFVRKAGFKPVYRNRVGLARELLTEQSFDYFLLDLNLPDGTGFDLIPYIKENFPGSRIVIISAYDSSQELSRAEEMGVHQFIKKPFTKRALLEALS